MNFLQRMGASVKAFQMRFSRTTYRTWEWAASRTDRWRAYQVGQGLESSVVVAPLQWMQRNFPDAPLRIRTRGDQEEEIEPSDSGPGALLMVWENPNEYYDARTMAKALLADYKTTGNAYILKLRNASGRWIQSWWAPSYMMTPRWPEDGTEFLSHWEYNPDGIPQRVEVQDVIHFRDGIDPRNSRLGFCAFQSLVREIFTDEEGARFTAAILSNLGVPGVIISPATQVAGAGANTAGRGVIFDTAQVKASFRSTFGGDNRGDAMVLSAATDVKVLSFNPQQLTLRDLRKIPEERVSGVFGVAAIVSSFGAGLDRSTFANFGEAREASYEEALIPTQNDFAAVLKKHGLSEFVSDVSGYLVDFDLSEVRVLSEDQNKIWERAGRALAQGGISRRRYKELIGEKPEDGDVDEVYYIPTSVVPTPADENFSEPTPEPDTGNPLTLPAVVPSPNGGNGNGGGTRVPVGAR